MIHVTLGGVAPFRRCGTTLASAFGLIALLASGCGGGDGGGTNPPPPGAAPDGGAGGSVGAPRGVDGGRRDAPATTPPPVGGATAVAKFCNGLRRQSGPIEFTLEVGTPPVRFVAGSGTCTPLVGQACTTIQAGTDVNVALYLDGEFLGQSPFNLPAGQDIVFEPELVMMPNMPTGLRLVASVYDPGACPQIDLVEVTPDGGAPRPPSDAGPPRPGI